MTGKAGEASREREVLSHGLSDTFHEFWLLTRSGSRRASVIING
jgi:hypothetical protein